MTKLNWNSFNRKLDAKRGLELYYEDSSDKRKKAVKLVLAIAVILFVLFLLFKSFS